MTKRKKVKVDIPVDLWASNLARLILITPDGRLDILIGTPATVIVGECWLTLQGGETRSVHSPDGRWRHATGQDVMEYRPLG